jgi:hypothetical protein
MEATILDPNLQSVGVIDTYKSFIWNDRYDEAGDFEISLPIRDKLPNDIKKGNYLWNDDSDHVMMVESIGYEDDDESGGYFLVSGRSAESMLERRIVWHKRVFLADDNGVKPNLQNGIAVLLMENIIEPTPEQITKYNIKKPVSEVRKISNFIFEESTDERITSLDFEGQYLGDDLYKVITTLCKENEIGFSITLNDKDQFVFKLIIGEDRSYGTEDEPQIANPYVVFSVQNDNLISTSYIDSDQKLKNVALVVGETEYDKEGEEISRLEYEEGSLTGIERREIFVDATNMGLNDEDGGTMTADQYRAQLKRKAIDALIENTPVAAFAAEIEPMVMYVYGEDYIVGDIVQVVDKYGTEARARVSEYIMTCDENGTAAYPTFKIIQKGAYEE